MAQFVASLLTASTEANESKGWPVPERTLAPPLVAVLKAKVACSRRTDLPA